MSMNEQNNVPNQGQPIPPMQGPPNQPMLGQSPPWFIPWMIVSILELAMCNMLSGVLTLVFILLGDSDYKQGKYMEAEKKKKTALIITIVGVVISAVLVVLVFMFFGSILAYIAANFQ